MIMTLKSMKNILGVKKDKKCIKKFIYCTMYVYFSGFF